MCTAAAAIMAAGIRAVVVHRDNHKVNNVKWVRGGLYGSIAALRVALRKKKDKWVAFSKDRFDDDPPF